MRFTTEILDEIRSLVPVSRVAGRRVSLVRAGREWKGLSPFQHERTPSFCVNDQKRFYHCFSSGRHGDVFTFLMETEGLTFPEAVEALAAEAGIDLPPGPAEGNVGRSGRRELLDALEAAGTFFRARLADEEGDDARSFLDRRGIDRAARERFGMGYAPAGLNDLRDHLLGLGFDDGTLADAGLVGTGTTELSEFDRFRDRITLPITDAMGRTIGFGARALSDRPAAKYLNSPDTPVFRKGQVLYNFAVARSLPDTSGRLVVVEGYLDVVALDGAERRRTVSTMGTALTREQLALAWRLDDEPVLCFDGDAAGLRAAHRAIDVSLEALEPGRSVRIARLPAQQDPDALVQAGRIDEFDAALREAEPLVDALWRRETAGRAVDTPERAAGVEASLRAALARIRHPVVRRHYGVEIERRLGGTARFATGEAIRTDPLEASVVAILEAHPDLRAPYRDVLRRVGLLTPEGGLPGYDPAAVPAEDKWASGMGADPPLVDALMVELLRVLERRSIARAEEVLDAAFRPCAVPVQAYVPASRWHARLAG